MFRVAMIGFGAVLATAAVAPAADPAEEVSVGVVGAVFKDVPASTVKVLGGPLRNLFAKQAGVAGGNIELADDPFHLAEMLGDGKCRLGVFHGYEFAWVKAKHPDLEPLVVTVYTTGRPRGCVVVHKNSPATLLVDLKAQGVTVPARTRGHCLLYLAKQRTDLPSTTAAPQPPGGTPEDALDAVVSKTAAAALVDAAAVVGYEKLHPGAAKNLRVLCESELFPQNVVAYSTKTLPAGTAAKLREAMIIAHTVPAGKPLMMFWGITRFDAAPPDYADHLAASTKEYPAPMPVSKTPPASGN